MSVGKDFRTTETEVYCRGLRSKGGGGSFVG